MTSVSILLRGEDILALVICRAGNLQKPDQNPRSIGGLEVFCAKRQAQKSDLFRLFFEEFAKEFAKAFMLFLGVRVSRRW